MSDNKIQSLINKEPRAIRGGYRLWIIVSGILGIIGTFQVYPFIGLADGFSRWNMAMEILETGSIQSDTLLSPIIPYAQAVSYKITNSYGLYTFIQATLFYSAVGILMRLMIGDVYIKILKTHFYIWIMVSFLVVLIPTVYVFPLMLTDSSPVFVLITLFGWTILSNISLKYKLVVYSLIGFLCVGIRINSLIMFLVVIGVFTFRGLLKKQQQSIISAVAVLTGCVLGVISVSAFTPGNHNAATLGMVWELIGEATNTGDSELIEKLGKYGNIEEAMNRYGEPYLNSIVWDNNPPYPAMQIAGEYSKDITQLYIREVARHPIRFVRNKWYYVSHTLGIFTPLIPSTRGVHGVDDRTKSMGALDTYIQGELRQIFFATTDRMAVITLRPLWALIVTFFLVTVVSVLTKSKNFWTFILFPSLAAIYYGSFTINTQAFEYRYYAPTFYIFLCTIVCSVIEILCQIYIRITTGEGNDNDI